MNPETLIEVNESLVERVKTLEALIARQNKKLDLCLEFLNGIGHLFPMLYKKFEDAIKEVERGQQ